VMPSSSVKHILGNDILDAESSCDVKPAFHFAGTVSLGQPPPKSQTNVAFVIGHLCWDSSRDFKDFAFDDADESGPHPDMVPIYLMPGPDRPERLESPAPIAAWTVVNQSNKSIKLVMDALFQGEATHNATVETTTLDIAISPDGTVQLLSTFTASRKRLSSILVGMDSAKRKKTNESTAAHTARKSEIDADIEDITNNDQQRRFHKVRLQVPSICLLGASFCKGGKFAEHLDTSESVPIVLSKTWRKDFEATQQPLPGFFDAANPPVAQPAAVESAGGSEPVVADSAAAPDAAPGAVVDPDVGGDAEAEPEQPAAKKSKGKGRGRGRGQGKAKPKATPKSKKAAAPETTETSASIWLFIMHWYL
jgi:hypothetical protein